MHAQLLCGLVHRCEGRARQFQLCCGFQGDRSVVALKRNDLASSVLAVGLMAELSQTRQHALHPIKSIKRDGISLVIAQSNAKFLRLSANAKAIAWLAGQEEGRAELVRCESR